MTSSAWLMRVNAEEYYSAESKELDWIYYVIRVNVKDIGAEGSSDGRRKTEEEAY